MTVFLDTNILLDYFDPQRKNHNESKKIIYLCYKRKLLGCISVLSFTNMFYIMRKTHTINERKNLLKLLKCFLEVIQVDTDIIDRALNNDNFGDFEDCVQYECAKLANVDYIITGNIKDYKENDVACVTPEAFLNLYETNNKTGD